MENQIIKVDASPHFHFGSQDKRIVISKLTMKPQEEIYYSKIDNPNHITLTENVNLGFVDITLKFTNIGTNPYCQFWSQMIQICLDEQPLTPKPIFIRYDCMRLPCYTCVGEDGFISVRMRYYLQSEDEVVKFQNAEILQIEGYLAFQRKTSTYLFSALSTKNEQHWVLRYSNTSAGDMNGRDITAYL